MRDVWRYVALPPCGRVERHGIGERILCGTPVASDMADADSVMGPVCAYQGSGAHGQAFARFSLASKGVPANREPCVVCAGDTHQKADGGERAEGTAISRVPRPDKFCHLYRRSSRELCRVPVGGPEFSESALKKLKLPSTPESFF
ncbi:hypothetical protein GN956_G16876 [Arapaima gigas]